MSVLADILPSIVFGLFVFVALISGLVMIKAETRQTGGAENRIADLCFWLMIAAIVGARCGSLLTKPEAVLSDPVEVLRIWNGGSFYFGGAAAALAVGAAYIKRVRLPVWKTADSFAPALAIGHFFVWIGCFFSGLCSIRSGDAMLEALLLWPGESINGLVALPSPGAGIWTGGVFGFLRLSSVYFDWPLIQSIYLGIRNRRDRLHRLHKSSISSLSLPH